MNTKSTSTFRSFRVLLVTIALALAGTLGSVSADVLTPLEDTGGPGGGSGFGSSGPKNQNQLSIERTEDKLHPGGGYAGGEEEVPVAGRIGVSAA